MRKLFSLFLISVSIFYSCSNEDLNSSKNNFSPTLLSPANKTINALTSPTLSWKKYPGFSSYTLQVGINETFNRYVYTKSNISDTNQVVDSLDNYTEYFWHIRASNGNDTTNYSDVWSFTTGFNKPIISCIDNPNIVYGGKTYHVVQIGNQCWLKENLNIGNMIDVTQNASNNGIIEKHCYNNDPENCEKYGGLYQWDEAMGYSNKKACKGLCPDGFHIPTMEELDILKHNVSFNGNSLKAIGQGIEDGKGTNTTGFSALLAGSSYHGHFNGLASFTGFWTSGFGIPRFNTLQRDYPDFLTYWDSEEYWFSIRCIKD